MTIRIYPDYPGPSAYKRISIQWIAIRIYTDFNPEKLRGYESGYIWMPIQLYPDRHPVPQDYFVQCIIKHQTE